MAYIIRSIDIQNLLDARTTFESFRTDMKTDRDKAGAIQAYEYTCELAWKTMKRLLTHDGVEVSSPRNCIREAAINKMISDPLIWFTCLDLRNTARFSYCPQNCDAVIEISDSFSQALTEFTSVIKQL